MRPQRYLLLLTVVCAACQTPATRPSATATRPAFPSPQASLRPATADTPPSPSPTPSPPPAPRTFTDTFDKSVPYWSFAQADNGQPAPGPKITAGFLRFDLTVPNLWMYAIYDSQAYTDVRADARVVSLGSGADLATSGSAGILCRYTRDRGWYEFNIYADQTYTLLYGQGVADGVVRYTPLVRSRSEKIQGEGVNDIGLRCQGNILTPFINGTQLRQRVEDTYDLTSGTVGISAASFQGAATIIYDWVKVGEP